MESIPQDLPFSAGSPTAQPLAQAWLQLLDTAQESVHIASYYWSLTGLDIGVNDSSSQQVGPGCCFLTMKYRLTQPWFRACSKSHCCLYRAQLWAGTVEQGQAPWVPLEAEAEALGLVCA